MKNIFTLCIILLCSSKIIIAQTSFSNNGILKISNATDTFFINGNFTNNAAANFINEGNFFIQGNFINNQTAALSCNGTIAFTGSNSQSVSSTNALTNITVNKAAGSVTLGSNIGITGTLKLTSTTSKLSIGGNTLYLSGSIDAGNTGFITGSQNSSLTIDGSGSFGTLFMDQSSNGTSNALQNFTVNRNNQTINLGNTLRVLNVLTPTAGTIASSGNLVMASSATNTARIATANSNNYITGDVTVERYISALNNRAYRLLTPTVTTTTTIKANWQEGVNNTSTSVNVSSATPGYGTHITGTGGSTNGFDVTQNNSSSLFTYTYGATEANDQWTAVTNTNINTLDATKGYLIFLRGNRDNINTINTATGNSNTILRAKGALIMGDYNFTNLQSNGRFSLITNPYASPILWDNSSNGLYTGSNAANFENTITVWDPNINTRGGFITVNHLNVTGGGSSSMSNQIQSGQAFFVQAKSGVTNPTFSIKEINKSTNNNLDVYRTGSQTEILKTLLYYTDNTGVVRNADGVTSVFNNSYSNDVDANDAQQMENWDEDVAIKRNNYLLSIEARQLADANDTIFLAVSHLKTQTYTWKFVPKNFNAPNLQAQLKDNFTNTLTNISFTDTTVINFTTTTNAASKAADRFSVIFKNNQTLPVKIAQLNAYTKNNGIQIAWQVNNALDAEKYQIEKSNDGINFSSLTSVNATQANNYAGFDANPNEGNNFYRIKIFEKSGTTFYSSIVKVTIAKQNSGIVIYPNPVTSNQLNLQLNNLPKGQYQLNIVNKAGQAVYTTMLQHLGGSATQNVQLTSAVTNNASYQAILIKDTNKYLQSFIKL